MNTFSSKLYYIKIYKGQLTNKSVFPDISDCLMTQNNNITKVLRVLCFRSNAIHLPQRCTAGIIQWAAAFSLSWFLDDYLLIRNEVLVCPSTRCEDKERRKEIKQGTQMKCRVNALLSGLTRKCPCHFFLTQGSKQTAWLCILFLHYNTTYANPWVTLSFILFSVKQKM